MQEYIIVELAKFQKFIDQDFDLQVILSELFEINLESMLAFVEKYASDGLEQAHIWDDKKRKWKLNNTTYTAKELQHLKKILIKIMAFQKDIQEEVRHYENDR